MEQFKSKQNLQLLWDVLLDELQLTNSNQKMIINIKSIFDSNISPFMNKSNQMTPLIQLNKIFLSQVVLAVNRLFPQTKKIKIYHESNYDTIVDDVLYTHEDIQEKRRTEFDIELDKKRGELDQYMNINKPLPIDFSDKPVNNNNSKTIEELINERNEFTIDYPVINNNNNNNVEKKKVTFDIFSKLKQITEEPIIKETIINNMQYETQESLPLPEVKREEIVSKKETIREREREDKFISNNEIIKLLQEINNNILLLLNKQ